MATKTVVPLLMSVALFCFTLLGQTARAEKADRNKAMVLEASKVTLDELTGLRTAYGPVVLTKGTLLIKADRMEFREDAKGFITVVATGKPATFKQKRDVPDQYVEGAGERVDWTDRDDIFKLQQRANMKVIDSGKVADEVYGAIIVYDAKTEQYSVDSGPGAQTSENPSGRVRIVIQPKNIPASTAAPIKPLLKPSN
jgi:lipopolysaccharide export system protein LptA